MCDHALQDALETRVLYRLGKITQEEAKKRIAPYAELFNSKSRELAKKYGQRPKLFSFAGFMR